MLADEFIELARLGLGIGFNDGIEVEIQKADFDYEIFEGWVMECGDPFATSSIMAIILNDIKFKDGELTGTAVWPLEDNPITAFKIVDDKFVFDFEDLEDEDTD